METIIIETGKIHSSRHYLRAGEAQKTRGPWAFVDSKFEWINNRRETGYEATQGETPYRGWIKLGRGGSPEFPAIWITGDEIPEYEPRLKRRSAAEAAISSRWERAGGELSNLIRMEIDRVIAARRIPLGDRVNYWYNVLPSGGIELSTLKGYSLPPEAEPRFREIAEQFGVPFSLLPPHP